MIKEKTIKFSYDDRPEDAIDAVVSVLKTLGVPYEISGELEVILKYKYDDEHLMFNKSVESDINDISRTEKTKMIRKPFLEKNGRRIDKISLLFINNKNKESCDACDENKKCASIRTISNGLIIICKDCLQEILNEF